MDHLGAWRAGQPQCVLATSIFRLLSRKKQPPSLSLICKLAEQLGTTTDYPICGKKGITTTIATIKADKKLSLKTKKALIALIEELLGSDND